MKRWLWISVLLCAAAGCQQGVESSLWQQNETLSAEKTELTLAVERLQKENNALAEQVRTLAAMDRDVRSAGLVVPIQIRLGRYTGFYDKSKDGKIDSLMVYLTPLDATQDAIKAAGSVQIELWDLSAEPAAAKLGTWQIQAEDLKKRWARSIMDSYYRVECPVEGIPLDTPKQLTLTVRFTDYLTGKVLADQQIVPLNPK